MAATDAIGCRGADALHESMAQEADRTSIGDMRRFGEVIEIPFVNDDP
jgi:hypothetical protein